MSNFQRSYRIYQQKKAGLPYKIGWKLDLILHLLNGNQIKKQQLDIEQQMQYEDLEDLNVSCLIIIFSNIIDTIFYNIKYQYKKCSIKKKGMFNSWISGVIGFENLNFIIKYSNKTKQFKISTCEIKKYKQNTKCFIIQSQKSNQYILKFQNQQQMKTNMKEFQKKIIQSKNQINYEDMIQYIKQNKTNPDERAKLNNLKTIIDKKQTNKKQSNFSLILQNKQIKSQNSLIYTNKPIQQYLKHINSQLKPVPHGYLTKYQTQNIIIALRQTNQAKIYIQYNLNLNISIRKLIMLLLIQKNWNKFQVFQKIQKSKTLPNQILITRKFDTFQITGDFIQINQKIMYTAFTEGMCMITSQSYYDQQNQNYSEFLYSKSLITVQYTKNFAKIYIQDQLRSKNYSLEILKTILYQIHKEIIKLDMIYQKNAIVNFKAQSIIQNIIEQENSRIQSGLQPSSLCLIQNQENNINNVCYNQDFMSQKKQIQQQLTNLNQVKQFKCLTNPQQMPNQQFIIQIRRKQYQKYYFKHKFSDQILHEYEDYIPFYRVDKMIESKQYQILSETMQLKFINQQLLNNQKDTLKFILRQLGTNLITGKSILNLSLPVQIFQGRSALERCAAAYAYAPDLFQHHGESDYLQQIKQVAAFIAGETSAQLVMKKPFNPILGQTFQGFTKGIPIYFQQISHNPPIMSYYSVCEAYQLYGNLVPYIDMGVNTGVGGNLSPIHIKFKNGSHFQCYFAPSQISGLIYGDRKFRFYNKGYILERSLNFYAQFSVQNQKKGIYESNCKLKVGQVIGGIYKVKKQYFDEIDKFKKNYKSLKKFGGICKQHIIQKLNSISGIWFGDILVDNQVVNKDINLYPVEYLKNVLPSDSNLRLDVLYHKMNDLVNSQRQKQVLQVLQRNDKKLREKFIQNKITLKK